MLSIPRCPFTPPLLLSLRMAEISKGLVSERQRCRLQETQNSSQLTRQLARRHHSLGIAERCHEAAGVCTHTHCRLQAALSQNHLATLVAQSPQTLTRAREPLEVFLTPPALECHPPLRLVGWRPWDRLTQELILYSVCFPLLGRLHLRIQFSH